MIWINHTDIRHSSEMQNTNDPQASEHKQYIQNVLAYMEEALQKGDTVVITKGVPMNTHAIDASETLITLKVPSDLEVYRSLLGTQPEALPFQFLQGQLSQAMAENNMNANE